MFDPCHWRCMHLVRGVAIMVIVVVSVAVALSMVSNMIVDTVDITSEFIDLCLTMSVTPYFAVALMIVPIVLDIIYERKKTTLVEE